MLDECDEMLNMGFVDDVEKILGAGGDIQVGASAWPSWHLGRNVLIAPLQLAGHCWLPEGAPAQGVWAERGCCRASGAPDVAARLWCLAQVQTLLFSATLPSWVKDITRRFLQPGHKLVDLVGTDKMKVRRGGPSWTCLCMGTVPVCLSHAERVHGALFVGVKAWRVALDSSCRGQGAWIILLITDPRGFCQFLRTSTNCALPLLAA